VRCCVNDEYTSLGSSGRSSDDRNIKYGWRMYVQSYKAGFKKKRRKGEQSLSLTLYIYIYIILTQEPAYSY